MSDQNQPDRQQEWEEIEATIRFAQPDDAVAKTRAYIQTQLHQQKLAERRRYLKQDRGVLNWDRIQLRKAVANMKTDDPVHNQALDKVIALLDNVIEEE